MRVIHVTTSDMAIRYLLLDQLLYLQRHGYNVSGGPVGVGTATAKSMVANIFGIHIIGFLGTQLFWGGNPRLPIGG